jgi:hypothetical protein
MHDHGFAKNICKGTFRNACEIWQGCQRELYFRMPAPRFGEQAFGRIEALRPIAVRAKPRRVTTAAAADIRYWTRNEKPSNDRVKVNGRRLRLPIFGKRHRIAIVGTKRCVIHPMMSRSRGATIGGAKLEVKSGRLTISDAIIEKAKCPPAAVATQTYTTWSGRNSQSMAVSSVSSCTVMCPIPKRLRESKVICRSRSLSRSMSVRTKCTVIAVSVVLMAQM